MMTKFYDEVGISVENLYKELGKDLTNRNYIQVTCEDENRLFYDLYNENGQLVFCDGEVAKVVMLNDEFVTLMNQEEESEITLSINEFESALFFTKSNITDKELEKLWLELEDIPFDEVNNDLELSVEWNGFEKGTVREEIWHYFDENYSKGVAYLINEF